ncbi:MAG: hypothetical protein QXO86_01370 [Nitrososphaerota archaeon]
MKRDTGEEKKEQAEQTEAPIRMRDVVAALTSLHGLADWGEETEGGMGLGDMIMYFMSGMGTFFMDALLQRAPYGKMHCVISISEVGVFNVTLSPFGNDLVKSLNESDVLPIVQDIVERLQRLRTGFTIFIKSNWGYRMFMVGTSLHEGNWFVLFEL